MIPARGGSWFALLLVVGLASARPVQAQLPFDDIPGFGPDAVARSPRLLAMGRLSYVLEDPQHRIGLWELGRNPVGIVDSDSMSTVDFGPYSRSLTREIEPLGAPGTVRQDFHGREVRNYFEAWRRDRQTTYGVTAAFDLYQRDVPYAADQETRIQGSSPGATLILAGRLPFLVPDRLRYGLRAFASSSFGVDESRLFVENAAGQFIALDGTQVSSPNTFSPNEVDLRTVGIGVSTSYRFAEALTAALGYDFASHEIYARNEGPRHASEVREDRPYGIGQASITGRFGGTFKYGVDARGWRAESDQTWFYSVSAGTGQEPLQGRGELLGREEEGSTLRARALLKLGKVEVGAGFATHYREVTITPPPVGDPESFNSFLTEIFYRPGADTLVTPDSVVANRVADRGWEAGGGLATTMGSFLVAAEGRYFHQQRDQDISGAGPRRLGWEARGGVEWKSTGPIKIRTGYAFMWNDEDDFTEQNEYVTHSITAGIGLQPGRVNWILDLAGAHDWGSAVYNHPTAPTLSGRRIAARIRWAF
jgi:hypothetical protein